MNGSRHHQFVVAVGSGQHNAKVYEAERFTVIPLSSPATASSFMPDGNSFVTGGGAEGLAIWNLPSLLGHLDQNSDTGELVLEEGNSVEAVATPLYGPQVSSALVAM